jgi:hypothetical protein
MEPAESLLAVTKAKNSKLKAVKANQATKVAAKAVDRGVAKVRAVTGNKGF